MGWGLEGLAIVPARAGGPAYTGSMSHPRDLAGPGPAAAGGLASATMLAQAAAGSPLRIDTLHLPVAGVLGLCHFPGRRGVDARGRDWRRSVEADLQAVRHWGAAAVLSLVEEHEFSTYGVPDLGARVCALGMRWHHLPVPDMGVPPAQASGAVPAELGAVREALAQGQRVVVHCAAGLGRTGTVAAVLLVAQGLEPQLAIAQVRQARPGTLETAQQEAFVHALR
jgi:ADP-ribosyl-[dinitrogen reductase] hydrolase